MALLIKKELPNGLVVNYHRISSLNIITNVRNEVEISSYIDEEKRELEQQAIIERRPYNTYISRQTLMFPYDQNATVESTYELLKTLEEFKEAVDV